MRFFALRVAYGALAGLCLGLLTGAIELTYLTYSQQKLLMTPAQWSLLFLVGVSLYALFGAAVGAAVALVLAPITGRGPKARYFREVMNRDMLAPTLAPVIGVGLAVMGWVAFSPWILAALRSEGGRTWGLALVGFVAVVAALWGLTLFRLLRRRDEGQASVLPLMLPVPLVVMVLFVAGVVRPPAGGKGFGSHVNPALPNLVLITLDTYRADHLSWLGHPDVSTPTLDYFARKNVMFTDAVAPIPETAPSHASMLTGLHPLDHTVLDNASPLPDEVDTLAEYLQDQGYSTAAFVSAYSLDRDLNLDQGFAVYDDDFSRRVRGINDLALRKLYIWLTFRFGQPAKMTDLERPAPLTNDRARDWLMRHYTENFFLWVHYFEPHAPYIPHGLEGFEANGRPGDPTVDHVAILDERRNDYTDDEKVALARLYAEECSYLDRQLGDFLRMLEEYDVFDSSVIVIVGDHGESLGEHDIQFSHMGLYDPSIRVPFMIRAPALTEGGVRVEEQVRVQDVLPTTLRLLGFRYAAQMDGRDLTPLMRGSEGQDPGELADMQALLVGRMGKLGSGMWVGLRDRRWKYLRSPPPEAAEEFYWLAEDPDELQDVADLAGQAVEAARVGVNHAIGATSIEESSGEGDLSPEQRERLRLLGYVE